MYIIKNTFFVKIFFLGILFLSFLNINIVHSDGCEYKSQIDKCNAANKEGSTKSIEDFVCITGTEEQVAYQVVLDLEFKKVDDEMDEYIEKLEINKNIYFGKDKQRTYIDGINDIHTKKDYFYKKYINLCNIDIIDKVIACNIENKTSIVNAKNFFSNNGTPCKELINKKIEIFDDITFGVLMLNKQQITFDEKKTYDQGQRRNYDQLLDIMMINIGYIERIWQKIPSFLANPYK